MLRIGINCIKVKPNYFGGVNSYTFGLIEALFKIGIEESYTLFVSNSNKHMFEKYNNYKNVNIYTVNSYNKFQYILEVILLITFSPKIYKFVQNLLFSNLARQMDILCDIIYTPTTTLFPFSNKKCTVISIHDIQQFHYPENFSPIVRLYRKIVYSISVYNSSYIQASSNFIKNDLIKWYDGLSEDKIVVINEGTDIDAIRCKNKNGIVSLVHKYQIPQNYLFFPGQLWKHKNHLSVLKALRKLNIKENIQIPLIMTGAKYSASHKLFSFIKENNMDYVYYLGVVPFKDLILLYQNAKFLITAVLYESSSLPILEAAAAGVPIIASSTPPNIEMSKILKLNLFDPLDVDNLVNLLIKVWNNDSLIKEQVEHNSKNIKYYSWDNVARKYLKLFHKISKS